MLGLLHPRRWGVPPAPSTVEVDGLVVAWERLDDGGALGPLARGDGHLVVGLHGLGADTGQLRTLVPLPGAGAYLAPRGPHARGRRGAAWYLPPGPDDLDGWRAVAAPVVAFTRWAQGVVGVGPDRTALLGYSQGSAVVAATATLHPDLAHHVVLTSGALPQQLAVLPAGGPARALLQVGLRDPLVDPHALATLRGRWRAAGTALTSVDHDVPHVASPAMAREVDDWLAAATP